MYGFEKMVFKDLIKKTSIDINNAYQSSLLTLEQISIVICPEGIPPEVKVILFCLLLCSSLIDLYVELVTEVVKFRMSWF